MWYNILTIYYLKQQMALVRLGTKCKTNAWQHSGYIIQNEKISKTKSNIK